VKVYRINEVRRFLLESGENNRFNFQCLSNQLQRFYSGLDPSRVQVAWKDIDGDLVVISTDLELMDAVKNLPADNQTLRLHLIEAGAQGVAQLQLQQTEQQLGNMDIDGDPTLHRKACSECHGGISGIRYKCLTCPDYNLCSECTNKALHDEHPMIRIASPQDKSWKPAFIAAQASYPMGPHGFFHGGHHHDFRKKHHHVCFHEKHHRDFHKKHHQKGRHGGYKWAKYCQDPEISTPNDTLVMGYKNDHGRKKLKKAFGKKAKRCLRFVFHPNSSR